MDRLWEVLAHGGFGGTKISGHTCLDLELNLLLILKPTVSVSSKSSYDRYLEVHNFCLELLNSMAQWLGLQKVLNSPLCTAAVFFVRRKIAIKFSL